jgi:hypothetical protein
MRDEFPAKVKDVLAKRVAYQCSNPDCRMQTIGPHSIMDKAISIGVAAHITAAAMGGPRYDDQMLEEHRTSIENGIWLCQSCSRLIDSDEKLNTPDLLQRWKREAERIAGDRLNKQLALGAAKLPFFSFDDLQPIAENGFYERQFDGQKVRVSLQGRFLHVEHVMSNGLTAYYVIDENGDVSEPKFPHPLSEYSLEIDPNLILRTEKEDLGDGNTREVVFMKWGKKATIIRDGEGKLAALQIEKGSTLNHIEKKIMILAPDFKS